MEIPPESAETSRADCEQHSLERVRAVVDEPVVFYRWCLYGAGNEIGSRWGALSESARQPSLNVLGSGTDCLGVAWQRASLRRRPGTPPRARRALGGGTGAPAHRAAGARLSALSPYENGTGQSRSHGDKDT